MTNPNELPRSWDGVWERFVEDYNKLLVGCPDKAISALLEEAMAKAKRESE